METSLNPEAALLLRPGFELDVFIYRYVFDGVIEILDTTAGKRMEHPIPSFSRRADASKTLMIKMVMENSEIPIVIKFGDELCDEARSAGHIHTDKIVPVWKMVMGINTGYGRSVEEATCKLAIVIKMREDAA